MFDAVFFDLDGTLVDTERLAVVTGIRAFADVGHAVDEGFMHRLVGKAEPQAAEIIRSSLPGIDLAAFHAAWRLAFDGGLDNGLDLKAGAAELLEMLDHPLGLVTSTGRQGAHHKLGLAGIAHHFRTVVTFDDVRHPKPAPEPYLLAAERLGVDPARCLVFEDSDVGAEAAHLAGCVVVQVPDVAPTDGRYARHLAADLLAGARAAGVI
ncbi:HAD family phosphatase [Tabrizicola sp. TH137]|uniref:HAD family hydrolase n=1 Tax=Tabrizicola sp. TH137 TaxID=2067452 RepID=UPI000C7D8FF6|nr:HAD family phosphatase [Tabrizicola sp. TH137]PLL14303.1 HAD family phosphatase [Tabrizicola sp. TH137]